MHIIYSQTAPALKAGQRYQNPRFFAGPVEGATSVEIIGSWPAIAAAYQAAAVQVNDTAPAKAGRRRK